MAQNAKVCKVKVIRKGHRFVESEQRLPLLNKHKKFENDAIARFCCSRSQSERWKKNNKKKQNTATRPITRLQIQS